MKILVTGAAGQVGRELVEAAQRRALTVAGFDSKTLDITDASAVAATIAHAKPDCVINAAAYTAVDRAESESVRAFAVNRDGVAHLADACRAQGIALLHLSTDYVFDGSQRAAYDETAATAPTSVYGASKLAGEQALAARLPRHVILRVSWVFGRYGNNFVKTMLRLGRERDSLGVVNDQYGAPTGARAIAERLLDIACHPQLGTPALPWGVRHLVSEPGITWYGFAQRVFARASALGLLAQAPQLAAIASSAYPTPVRRPANSKLASTAAWPPGLAAPLDWITELDAVLQALRTSPPQHEDGH